MPAEQDIFQENRRHYQDLVAQLDLAPRAEPLGGVIEDGALCLDFMGQPYRISHEAMLDAAGDPPAYAVAVILYKYVLICPEGAPPDSDQWVAFKDFKRFSHFTNVNFFLSDTEMTLKKSFSGRLQELKEACAALGGRPQEMDSTYDCAFAFSVLPKITLLLVFNDADEEFPAQGTVLFSSATEHYLDPEPMAMLSAVLIKRLKAQAGLA